MKPAFALGLFLRLCLAPVMVHGQGAPIRLTNPIAIARPLDVVSANSRCYLALRRLEDAGIHTGFCFDTCGRRPWTRGEFAQALTHVMAPLADSPANLVRQDLETRLQTHPLALAALKRLASEFQPELTARGQDVPRLQGRLAALQPIAAPFPDVPKNHWAYQSVETLRKAGIVTGEPGGKFHG